VQHKPLVKLRLRKGFRETHHRNDRLLHRAGKVRKDEETLLQDRKMEGVVRTGHPEVTKTKKLAN
jgi:hypothetical protein